MYYFIITTMNTLKIELNKDIFSIEKIYFFLYF